MKGRALHYSAAELAWIEARHKLPRRELHRCFQARFARPDVGIDALKQLCLRRGWKTGRDGRLQKGNVPPNKGRKGYCAPGSKKGWFRKGERRGVAVTLYKSIGTERLSKDGYRERKIHDGMPLQSRWRAVHLIEWEAVNGPIPPGMCLKCLDGNKGNLDPTNWEAIPRAMLPRLNNRWGRSYETAPTEVKPVILATARLQHAASEARKRKTA